MRWQIGKATSAALLAAGLAAAYWGLAPRVGAADRPLRSGIVATGFDAKVRPQDDLFRHVNGGWLAEAKIPAEYGAYGSFMELRDKSLADLRAIIEEAARNDSAADGSEARKIGDLYGSFMDEKRIEELGLEPIKGDLARIDAVADKAALVRLIAELQRQGARGTFRLMVAPDAKHSDVEIVQLAQGGISLPDESFYREPRFQPIRDAFVKHVAEDVRAGRPARARRGGEAGHGPGDPAGERPLGPRQEPRRHANLQQEGPRRARGPDPRLRLVDLLRDRRRAGTCARSSSRSPSTSPRWPPPSRTCRWSSGKPGWPGTCSTRRRRTSTRRWWTRTSTSIASSAAPPSCPLGGSGASPRSRADSARRPASCTSPATSPPRPRPGWSSSSRT